MNLEVVSKDDEELIRYFEEKGIKFPPITNTASTGESSGQTEAGAVQTQEKEMKVKKPVRRTAVVYKGPMAAPMKEFTVSGRHVAPGTSQKNNTIYYTASNRYKGFGYKYCRNDSRTNKAGTSVHVICVQCNRQGRKTRNTVNTSTMMLRTDPDSDVHICMESGNGLPTAKAVTEQKIRSVNQLVHKYPNTITSKKGSEIIYNNVKEWLKGAPEQSAILSKLKHTNAIRRLRYHGNTLEDENPRDNKQKDSDVTNTPPAVIFDVLNSVAGRPTRNRTQNKRCSSV